jgi:diguanylate cyclase (GGDEF)-like protein/PAS domain S-box-containing protein
LPPHLWFQAVEAVDAGLVILGAVDDGYPVVYANPAYERLAGAWCAGGFGRRPCFLEPREDLPAELRRLQAEVAAGRPATATFRPGAGSGEGCYEVKMTPIHDRLCRATHFVGVVTAVAAASPWAGCVGTPPDCRDLALAAIGEGVCGVDADARITFANDSACRILGCSRDGLQGQPAARFFGRLAGKDRFGVGGETGDEIFGRGDPPICRRTETYRKKDGDGLTLEVTLLAMPHRCPGKTRAVVAFRDISDREIVDEAVVRLSLTLDHCPASVAITDTDGTIAYVNARFSATTGYEKTEAVGKSLKKLVDPAIARRADHGLWKAVRNGQQWSGDLGCIRKSGERFWELVSIAPIPAAKERRAQIVFVGQDISTRKEYEAQLLDQARLDQLTGLPNRMLAVERLSHAVERARRHNRVVSLLFLDLDHFKTVNDTLGHQAGDRLLREAAKRLPRHLRKSDTIARLGGDEFAVILPELASTRDAEIAVEKVQALFRQPFVIDGVEVFATCSIGVAVFPGDGEDATTLMKNADAAMYRCKENGRNSCHFFAPQINASAHERLRIGSNLRKALDHHEFSLHFQPIFSTIPCQLVSVEALLRWHSADLGFVGPDRFIPVAEETGLIVAIGEWVLQTACNEAGSWNPGAAAPPRVSVNVSARQFRDPAFVGMVTRVLAESGMPADRLELEVTETVLMQDAPATLAMLQELTRRGVRFSVDDFGKGYSSLAYLKRFPVHSLKIDRSFVSEATTDPGDAALVKAIVAMAHGLGLTVVGEGVETEEQLAFLRSLKCDLVQGYYFCKPMTAAAFADFLRQPRSAPPLGSERGRGAGPGPGPSLAGG